MSERTHRHTGDDQRINGMPKHMVGVSTPETLRQRKAAQSGNIQGRSPASKGYYWTVHPEPGACAACRAMQGQQYMEKPERPHPNCKCDIRQHSIPVVRIVKTLQGFEDNDTVTFSGDQAVTVEVRNLGPFAAGVHVCADQMNWGSTGLIAPGTMRSVSFSKLSELPVPWEIYIIVTGGDNSTLQYTIIS